MDTTFPLGFFNKNVKIAIKEYLSFINATDDDIQTLPQTLTEAEPQAEAYKTRLEPEKIKKTLGEIADTVCSQLGCKFFKQIRSRCIKNYN